MMVAGVTTEVCMQSTVREATDRGYEPLIITDATMSYFEHYRQQTVEQLVAQGALVARAANSTTVVKALSKAWLQCCGLNTNARIGNRYLHREVASRGGIEYDDGLWSYLLIPLRCWLE